MHYKRMRKTGTTDPRTPRVSQPCSVEGCGSASLARGYCSKHWSRWRKYGTTDLPTRMDIFWSRVDRSGGPSACWPWTAGGISDGYGHFWISEIQSNRMAHRVAYEDVIGPVPDGMVLDHVCHNNSGCKLGNECPHRRCCNPTHLEPVTNVENTLRGEGPNSRNAVPTECPSGHPYDEVNTGFVSTSGHRYCRACHRIRAAERRARARGERP